jgi:hypothetical protein
VMGTKEDAPVNGPKDASAAMPDTSAGA